jgi:hypothetical protein
MFALSQEDIFNVANAQTVLQDPQRARREMPLALNHFLNVGHMAFENVAQSARVHGFNGYVFEDGEISLGQGIEDWTRRYYRAITARDTPSDRVFEHGEGLEARRTYVRDSMTSVLGLAGTAFLARAAFRYINMNFGPPQPFRDQEVEEVYERLNERRITPEVGWNVHPSLTTSEERSAQSEDGEVHVNIEQPPAGGMAPGMVPSHNRRHNELEADLARIREQIAREREQQGVDEHQMAEGEEHMEQLQDGHANDPHVSRHRVVNEVLRPINERIRAFDRYPPIFDTRQRRLAGRQQTIQDAIDEGINTLDRIAPDEWRLLRRNLRMRRDAPAPAAYDRRRPNAPFSMFTARDLQSDDPDVNTDTPEALGGDHRMRAPGLGFQPGEGAWRERTRNAGVGDPVIALTETPGRNE